MIKNTIFMAVAALALCGCGQNGTKKAGQATGADRDGHDCIGSAGYVWSEVRGECIRPFETGVKMLPITVPDTGAVYAAYIVFSADSARAELFLPGSESSEVLDRRDLPGGGHAWNAEDDDTKNVRQADGRGVIEQRDNTIYTQDPYTINDVFDRTDLDGTVFDLTQYVTADGFGYKNDMMDLRGKGREATLTMRDGLILSLTERK